MSKRSPVSVVIFFCSPSIPEQTEPPKTDRSLVGSESHNHRKRCVLLMLNICIELRVFTSWQTVLLVCRAQKEAALRTILRLQDLLSSMMAQAAFGIGGFVRIGMELIDLFGFSFASRRKEKDLCSNWDALEPSGTNTGDSSSIVERGWEDRKTHFGWHLPRRSFGGWESKIWQNG